MAIFEGRVFQTTLRLYKKNYGCKMKLSKEKIVYRNINKIDYQPIQSVILNLDLIKTPEGVVQHAVSSITLS